MLLFERIRLRRLFNVWGEYMPETPEVLNNDPTFREEDTEPMPPEVGVRCATCNAERGEFCTTVMGLEMRVCHRYRALAYARAAARRTDITEALKRGI